MVFVQKYTQFFDLETSPEKFTVFKINAGGLDVLKRCAPFFGCFNKYKLGKVAVKLVPAATLPVDPTGLSTSVGENTCDPRDMFNPGLVRITNGDSTTSIDFSTLQDMDDYYATMLDPRWFKFRLQEGFTREAVPLVYNIAEPARDPKPGSVVYSQVKGDMSLYTMKIKDIQDGNGVPWGSAFTPHSSTQNFRALIQNDQVPLGWLPTSEVCDGVWGVASIPEIDLITFIFPKAYKTKFYYRMFVETTVLFDDPVAIDPLGDGHLPVDVYLSSSLKQRPIIPGGEPADLQYFAPPGHGGIQ